ncbi:hypothetical protein B9479_001941 [Cryptococcus floricola]|uniref:Uncharacterized protein n=1 Tax=Cryptococcus floricola TaxID=2591691 RepID=A0A5D3B4C4_9TREE|nr:hypothetical protein B9479_001941 [Cryptococcus floricola]
MASAMEPHTGVVSVTPDYPRAGTPPRRDSQAEAGYPNGNSYYQSQGNQSYQNDARQSYGNQSDQFMSQEQEAEPAEDDAPADIPVDGTKRWPSPINPIPLTKKQILCGLCVSRHYKDGSCPFRTYVTGFHRLVGGLLYMQVRPGIFHKVVVEKEEIPEVAWLRYEYRGSGKNEDKNQWFRRPEVHYEWALSVKAWTLHHETKEKPETEEQGVDETNGDYLSRVLFAHGLTEDGQVFEVKNLTKAGKHLLSSSGALTMDKHFLKWNDNLIIRDPDTDHYQKRKMQLVKCGVNLILKSGADLMIHLWQCVFLPREKKYSNARPQTFV